MKAYLMAIRVVKHHCFYREIVIESADKSSSGPVPETHSLLGESKAKIYLKGSCKEYAAQLADKSGHICSTLDSILRAELEMVGGTSCKTALEDFEPDEPKGVDRALSAARLAMCVRSVPLLAH